MHGLATIEKLNQAEIARRRLNGHIRPAPETIQRLAGGRPGVPLRRSPQYLGK